MYLWGGICSMDAVWKGWTVPISDYVRMEEAAHYINDVTGQISTAEDAAAFTQDVADKWRQANRLLLERYKQWGAQKAEAGG